MVSLIIKDGNDGCLDFLLNIFHHFTLKILRSGTMMDRILEVNGKQISVAQDLSLSHAGSVWDGALTIAHYWNKHPQIAKEYIADRRVLELGSGTGFTGIAAAAFNPQVMYLTDLPEYLPILEVNSLKNSKVSDHEGCLRVAKLQWGNPDDIAQIEAIDTIIGSELAYDKECVIQLMKTIKHYRQVNPKMKVMIAYYRHTKEWKDLRVKFEENFAGEYKQVAWEDFDEDYRDEKIGIIYLP